eukprot:scaffold174871_cov15-Tisochrysis_lutea.AAC.1
MVYFFSKWLTGFYAPKVAVIRYCNEAKAFFLLASCKAGDVWGKINSCKDVQIRTRNKKLYASQKAACHEERFPNL